MRTTVAWLAVLFALYMWVSQYVGKGVSQMMVGLTSQDFVHKFMLVIYWLVVAGILGILVFLIVDATKRAIKWYIAKRHKPLVKEQPIVVDKTEDSSSVCQPRDFIGLSPEQITAYFDGLLKLRKGETDATAIKRTTKKTKKASKARPH